MTVQNYDIIIIGGGPMGLAAAYYAAQEGARTAVLERFDFFNDRGASGGDSRQFRIQYNEIEISRLVLDSVPLWNELQSHTDEELLRTCGCLWFGNPNVTGAEGQINTVIGVMDALGLDWQRVQKAEIEAKYGFENLPANYSGFFQKDGAAINYPGTLRVLQRKAKESGLVAFRNHQNVTVIRSAQEGVYVETESETFLGRKLILTPGPYVNEVLSLLGLELDIVIWEMVSAFFRKTSETGDFPTWITFDESHEDDPMLYYGFPELDWGTDGPVVKVAANYPTRLRKTMTGYDRQPDPATVDRISRWVERYMRGLDPRPLRASTCVCPLVPQPDNPWTLRREMILDFLPSCVPFNENIVLYATGWAAKLIPLIGRICVDLALHGETPHDIEKLRFTEDLLVSSAIHQ